MACTGTPRAYNVIPGHTGDCVHHAVQQHVAVGVRHAPAVVRYLMAAE